MNLSMVNSTESPLEMLATSTLAQEVDNFEAVSNVTNVSMEMTPEDLAHYSLVLNGSRFIVQRILVPLVLMVGLAGNTVTIIVLTRRQMRSTTNLYLTALAISDLLYLVFTFLLSFNHHDGIHKETVHYYHFYRYALWFVDGSSSTSIWLTVTFTIERYIAVCHPIKGKVFCTEKRAKRVIFGVFFFCFVLTASTPHEWIVVEKFDNVTNATSVELGYSWLGQHNAYTQIFYWFSAVMFILLPLVLLAVFNSILIHIVKLSRVQRYTMTNTRPSTDSHSQSQETKITIMLIAVVLLALVCQLPTAIMLLYTSFVGTMSISRGTRSFYISRILGNVFNLLTAVNASLNFLLYCAMSDKYRRTFLKTFCKRWYRQPSPMHSWMATNYSNCEDGSPRFTRMSSVRMSRRSSHRSSCSGSPHSSPSNRRSSSHMMGRRPSPTHHYLTVPNPGQLTTGPPTTDIVKNHTQLDAPAENLQLLGQVVPEGICRKSDQLRQSSTSGEPPAAAPEAAGDPMLRRQSSQQLLNSKPSGTPNLVRRLSLRLQALRPSRRKQMKSGRHIVITCQQPSLDEQTAL